MKTSRRVTIFIAATPLYSNVEEPRALAKWQGDTLRIERLSGVSYQEKRVEILDAEHYVRKTRRNSKSKIGRA
jgi:hypothetical protein